MSGEISGDVISAIKGFGDAISDLLDLLLTWLTGGSTGPIAQALKDLLKILEAGVALAFFLLLARNIGVLGAGGMPEGSLERQAYDKLRASLAEGNTPTRLYAKWLGWFLAHVDKFFEGKEPGRSGRCFRAPSGFRNRHRCGRRRLRPLPVARLALSHRDAFSHLGHFRPCRPGGVRAPSAA